MSQKISLHRSTKALNWVRWISPSLERNREDLEPKVRNKSSQTPEVTTNSKRTSSKKWWWWKRPHKNLWIKISYQPWWVEKQTKTELPSSKLFSTALTLAITLNISPERASLVNNINISMKNNTINKLVKMNKKMLTKC